MRSPTGLIIVSPAQRGGDWILPNLNTMPCSKGWCRDHAQHDKYREYDQDDFNHCQQPLSGDARPVRPGPSAESQARPLPATLSVNTYHGRRKFWCAATDDLQARAQRTPAGRVRGRTSSPATGGGSIGNGGAAWAAFMAGFDPADDASRRRVLAPRVSGRSRDRRHCNDRTGTHAGWRSAQREIAPAQLADRRPTVVPMFCVPAGA